MKKIIVSIFLVCLVFGLSAQNNQVDNKKTIDKSSMTLRPNSREYAPVRRSNMHQRMEARRTRAMIQNRVLRNTDRINQMQKNRPGNRTPVNRLSQAQQRQMRSRQELIKRQQQRMLRRKIIMQQRKRMRR